MTLTYETGDTKWIEAGRLTNSAVVWTHRCGMLAISGEDGDGLTPCTLCETNTNLRCAAGFLRKSGAGS